MRRPWPAPGEAHHEAIGGFATPAATAALADVLGAESDGLELFAAQSPARQNTPAAREALAKALALGEQKAIDAALMLGQTGNVADAPGAVTGTRPKGNAQDPNTWRKWQASQGPQ